MLQIKINNFLMINNNIKNYIINNLKEEILLILKEVIIYKNFLF